MPKIPCAINLKVLRRRFNHRQRSALEILLRCHLKPDKDNQYPLHHKDGNIKNNRPENLRRVT